ESIVEPPEEQRVVARRGVEDHGHELEPGVERIAAELEPVAIDLNRVVIPDRQHETGAVGPGPVRAREAREAQLGDQIEVEREWRALRVPRLGENELALLLVVSA